MLEETHHAKHANLNRLRAHMLESFRISAAAATAVVDDGTGKARNYVKDDSHLSNL